MPASSSLVVKKTDDHSFSVYFPKGVAGPGSAKAGDQVPVEWLRAALDYYVQHRSADGSLAADKHAAVKALW